MVELSQSKIHKDRGPQGPAVQQTALLTAVPRLHCPADVTP